MLVKTFWVVLTLLAAAALPPPARAQTARNLARDLTATVTASTTINQNFPPAAAVNGDRRGVGWGQGSGGWNDGTREAWGDLLQVSFGGERQLAEIRVYHVQNPFTNPVEPTEAMTSGYANRDFDLQYFDGLNWVTPPGGAIRGNNKVIRSVTLPPGVTATAARVLCLSGDIYCRVVELEAIGF